MHSSWPSEYILLALLCERPMHGYELSQLVRSDEGLRSIWRIERSEIYFLLRKLRDAGLISATGEEQGGGPTRVIHAPTPAGQAILSAWLRTPEMQPRNLRTALLARIYLALRRDPALATQLIDAQRRTLSAWLQREEEHEHPNPIVAMVHRLRAAQVEATLGALDELEVLAAGAVRPPVDLETA